MKRITCDILRSDAFFQPFLKEFSRNLPMSVRKGGAVFRKGAEPRLDIQKGKDGAVVVTAPTLALAGRALGALLADLPLPLRENPVFETNGMLHDCSRNAVPTLGYQKRWLRQMALAGYNLLMLYTEDVFELPDEPFFGYQRGRYSAAEIREIDDYARLLGIELVPCMQALGHLEQMFRWPCFGAIRDTGPILLAGEEKTYAFIRKMIKFWSDNVRSRRIHLNMDEAHSTGRGAYLDRNGLRPRAQIIAEHVSRVKGICDEFGLHPIMASDLLVPHSGVLSDATREIIRKNIPESVDLVYWDYYRDDEAAYDRLIKEHLKSGHHTILSPGVWCWASLWYGREYTEARLPPCFEAGRKNGVKEWLVTMWNDDGAVGDLDSSWNGVFLAAELAHGGRHVAERYEALFGVPYDRNRKIARMIDLVADGKDEFAATALLWDDPVLGLAWHQFRAGDKGYWLRRRKTFAEALKAAGGGADPARSLAGDLPRIRIILRFLVEKIDLRIALEKAAGRGRPDPDELLALAARYRAQSALVRRLAAAWRRFWLARYKPYGFEVVQNRLAGQAARQAETALRLREMAAGKADAFPELDAADIRCSEYPDWCWHSCATASAIV